MFLLNIEQGKQENLIGPLSCFRGQHFLVHWFRSMPIDPLNFKCAVLQFVWLLDVVSRAETQWHSYPWPHILFSMS